MRKEMHCNLAVLAVGRDSKVSMKGLARDTGLAYTTIYRLWNNNFTRIDKDTVETLLNHFGCRLSDLFEDREVV